MAKKSIYDSYSERELVDAILSGNEVAAIYLIYNRCYVDLRYLCYMYCNSRDEYLEDVFHEIYLVLKGKNGDWQPLTTWTGMSSLRTWLNIVASHWFQKNKDYLIGLREKKLYREKEDDPDPVEEVESRHSTVEQYMQKALLLEAINNLKNKDQKLVLVKELEGYSHEEIAEILNIVRRKENRIKIDRNGKEILADARAVDVLKQRAIVHIKQELGVK